MIYKGHVIEKYCNGEGKYVPNHVIREYYQSEKARIDRLIERESRKVEMTKSVNDCIDDFLKEMEG